MKTLHLLRHAKAEATGQTRDHDRPLSTRGIEAARAMAQTLKDARFTVDRVYCSSSRRTRETYELIKGSLGNAQVSFRDDLYLLDAYGLRDAIQELPGTLTSALFIGHDPGYHILANGLVKDDGDADLYALRRKFPTGALCTITFNVEAWTDIKDGTGDLKAFIRPRDMD